MNDPTRLQPVEAPPDGTWGNPPAGPAQQFGGTATAPATGPHARDPHPRVAGHCPMGCGTTLFLGAAGHVTCSLVSCPDPTAVDQLLHDDETDHLVVFGPDGFTIRHPLRERLGDQLFTCQLSAEITAFSGPPTQPGTYRAGTLLGGQWHWTRLPTPPPEPEPEPAEQPRRWTSHGHWIGDGPEPVDADDEPDLRAKCGGPSGMCTDCQSEAHQ